MGQQIGDARERRIGDAQVGLRRTEIGHHLTFTLDQSLQAHDLHGGDGILAEDLETIPRAQRGLKFAQCQLVGLRLSQSLVARERFVDARCRDADNGICHDCFLEIEEKEKNGCICF